MYIYNYVYICIYIPYNVECNKRLAQCVSLLRHDTLSKWLSKWEQNGANISPQVVPPFSREQIWDFPASFEDQKISEGILGHFRSFLESDIFGWKIYLSHPFSTWFTIERTSVPMFTQTQITTEIHGVFGDVFGTSTRFKIFWEDRKHRPENKFRALQHSKQICLVLLGGWAKPSKRRQLRESSNRPMSDGF
jgi:hypothetical protein